MRTTRERATGNRHQEKQLHAGLGVLLMLALLAPQAAAQRRPVFEWGLHSTAGIRGTGSGIANGPVSLVFGPRGAIRTLGSTRIALSIGTGTHGNELTARGEAALEYLLSPRASRRFGVYLGGGLAGVVGGGKGGYLLTYAGIERSPGLPGGWAFEAGLGGGFRMRVAYHWRLFPAGWRAQP